ncbi:Translocator protein [Halotydeus destructor]|nr:Translocator protein [Halotydeus destructor]
MADWKRIGGILVAVTIPLAAGYLPNIWLQEEPTSPWYLSLNKAPWNPPNWLFPVAWTFLYIVMGLASWFIYDTGNGFSGSARLPLIMYIVQLVVNVAWTPVFFGAHLVGLASLHLIGLVLIVLYTMFTFYQVNPLATYLMIPYLIWISYASTLTIYIWANN